MIEALAVSWVHALFADGGCIVKNPSEWGGTWAFAAVDKNLELAYSGSGVIPTRWHAGLGKTDWGIELAPGVSNNHAEFFALLRGLESLPAGWSGPVCSDSNVTLGRFFHGWSKKCIPLVWQLRGTIALKRLGNLTPVLLKGHPNKHDLAQGHKNGRPVSEWNVYCDKLCREAGAEWMKVHT